VAVAQYTFTHKQYIEKHNWISRTTQSISAFSSFHNEGGGGVQMGMEARTSWTQILALGSTNTNLIFVAPCTVKPFVRVSFLVIIERKLNSLDINRCCLPVHSVTKIYLFFYFLSAYHRVVDVDFPESGFRFTVYVLRRRETYLRYSTNRSQ
jgi:hypothetical protein